MPTEIRSPVVPPSALVTAQRPIIPKGVIVGAGLLMLLTIGIAGVSHHAGTYHIAMPPTTAVATRDLYFTDQHDGGVRVTDAATGAEVATVEPKTGGFIRGIMRGLVREHRLNDKAAGTPFRLTHWADGRLSIADPSTGESFDLEAFGSTNEKAFARFLDEGAETAVPAGHQAANEGTQAR